MTLPMTSPWCSIGTQIANLVSRPAPGPLLISCRFGSSGMTTVLGLAYCLTNTDPLSRRRRVGLVHRRRSLGSGPASDSGLRWSGRPAALQLATRGTRHGHRYTAPDSRALHSAEADRAHARRLARLHSPRRG